MVANPMQKKARNSFLLGMVITLIVCIAIFVLFYVLVIGKTKKEEEELGKKVMAYTLGQNVKSGDVVTSDLLIKKEVYESMIPTNYINESQFYQMELQDEYGNILYTDAEGNLYIEKDNKKYKTTTNNAETKIEVKKDEDGFYKVGTNGQKEHVENNIKVYSKSENEKYIVETRVLVEEDEQGARYITKTSGGKEALPAENVQVFEDRSNGEKYIKVYDNVKYVPTTTDPNRILVKQNDEGQEGFYRTYSTGEMEKINVERVPFIAKIDIYQNTVLTSDLFAKGKMITDDVRYVEYNMLTLPTTIEIGDYIDIRLTLPSGQDLIVVSKKEVKSILGDTIGLELTEGEILMMESAIVEAYIITASKLYAIQYIEPGNQVAAQKTYTPTSEVQGLISKNPNITNIAKQELFAKFNGDIRTYTESDKAQYTAEKKQNIEEGLKEEIENAKAAREAYLAGMNSY